MSAAIYFHPEAYTTSGRKLMGRNAAGESFLRGFFLHAAQQERMWVQTSDPAHISEFQASASHYERSEQIIGVTNSNLRELAQAGTAYFPGPGIGEHAVQRRFFGDASWSLCGITHTTSSARAMDAIAEWITAPVQPWDAIICTSNAVKANVETVLRSQATYLQRRLGASNIVLPKLPVIPLGIHSDEFHFSKQDREGARQTIGADSDTIVVLYTGRLSFHAKAHPLVMYQGLEYAAQASGKKITLIECGWHANEYIAQAFKEAAQHACPSVKVIHLDGRNADNRKASWASADIFCSLSDNIQETFGIVPIEAMAAGLPVVVSDWDGYRDTVRDGVDGFRIPTVAPGPGLGGDLAYRHTVELDTYDMYCGHTSSLIAVDLAQLSRSLLSLVQSKELREKMGSAGKKRAVENYDWRRVIKQYEELWAEQTRIRLSAHRVSMGQNVPSDLTWPARLDPSIGFAAYPTEQLTVKTRLRPTFESVDEAMQQIENFLQLKMVNYASYVQPDAADIRLLLARTLDLVEQGAPVLLAGDIVEAIKEEQRALMLRSLGWLLKLGIYTLP